MEQALIKAIGSGWKQEGVDARVVELEIWSFGNHINIEKALLDPLFWRALEKSCENWPSYWTWQTIWHEFIDHLISGKDCESFFTNLLTQKE